MAANIHSGSDLRKLTWKSEGGFKVATDHRGYYVREGIGSIITGFVFSVAISGSAGGLGLSILFFPEVSKSTGTLGEKAFGVFMLLIAALFAWLLVSSLRRGRWMVVFDRGEAGVPGEIRTKTARVPATQIRSLSTRVAGGRTPQSYVVAELHDGTTVTVGPLAALAWGPYFAQQAANWMGLPFRASNSLA